MTESIFISVPSVEDTEIFNLVEQVFDEADNPDKVYIGICHSIPFNSKKHINEINKRINGNNISQKFINFYRKMGVGYGRNSSISLYSGQDYVLQIDSHTNFSKSWDKQLIEIYNQVPLNMRGDRYMLTAYLPSYQILENNYRYSPDENIPRYSCYTSKKNVGSDQGINDCDLTRDVRYPNIPAWVTLRSVPGTYIDGSNNPIRHKEINNVSNFLPDNAYTYSRKINANFIFCDNKIINHYSDIYLWDYLFLEEEFIASIQSHSLGYNLIFPNMKLPLAHLYIDWYNEFYGPESRKSVTPDDSRMKKAQDLIDLYLLDDKNKEKIINYCRYAGLSFPDFESIDTFYIPRRDK